MKKNKVIFILLIVLVSITAWLIVSKRTGTIKRELRDFAVQDTSQVWKVFLVNKQNNSILLEREETNTWTVNQAFQARKDAVDLILKTFKRWDVKSPVSKAAFNNVVKNLAGSHTKVEIYGKDESEPFKTIFIGGPTQDMYGTYMMIEGSNTPFIVHIPGFSGYLSSRFFFDLNEWRNQKIFRSNFKDIASAEYHNYLKPYQSFEAKNLGNNAYSLIATATNKPVDSFDTVKVKQYLGAYKNISFERVPDELSPEQHDSIINSAPFTKLTLKTQNGIETSLTTYRKKGSTILDLKGKPYEWDLEKFYGRINDDSTIVVLQYFVMDPLLMDLDFFTK